MIRAFPRVTAAVVASALLLAGAFFPLWEMRADVRSLGMFRDGFIRVRIGGTGISGNIESFNTFGKMFGIRPLRPDEFVETRLFPLAVAATIAATVLWATGGRRWQRGLALTLLWGLPAGVVGLTQLRLAIMAFTRDPNASYYMEVRSLLLPVFGTKKLLGTTLFTRPGVGFILFVVAALLFTLLPVLLGRRGRSGPAE
jgi:hypothetical protein